MRVAPGLLSERGMMGARKGRVNEMALRNRTGAMEIQLTRGYVTLVDEADYDELRQWKWRVMLTKGHRYALRAAPMVKRQQGSPILMHRQILSPPLGLKVDHRNGDGLDNRRSNLRVATTQENARNARKRAVGSSLYKGVSWHSKRGLWQVAIHDAGKAAGRVKHWLGYFRSEEEAARVYDESAKIRFGEFALLNFPSSGAT